MFLSKLDFGVKIFNHGVASTFSAAREKMTDTDHHASTTSSRFDDQGRNDMEESDSSSDPGFWSRCKLKDPKFHLFPLK